MIGSIIFIGIFIIGILFFSYNFRRIIKNIKIGKPKKINDNIGKRLKRMFTVAIGQSKMVRNPIAGLMHIFVYAGFVIINIEVIEIILDGILHEHRIFAHFLGYFYNILIGTFEILAILTILACAVFLIRRNILRIRRFHLKEMTLWPRSDANIILITEILLMTAFLTMDASDSILQGRNFSHYFVTGSFPVSNFLVPLLSGLTTHTLVFIERFTWWFHIVGILAFLNYLPYSKHFHIILAFPNVFFSKLEPRAKFNNMEAVTNEVKLMLDPNADPYANTGSEEPEEASRFGTKDVTDLTWKSLMDAYSCTECGRCSAACPANLTGKKLSPRKIIMDVRDRLEEYSCSIKKNDTEKIEKSLLNNYITPEEIWACTSCNACTQECPVNIDHVSIILDLRRYLVLEESAAPSLLNAMFTNIENNFAPWQYPPSERINWANDIYVNQK